MVFGCQLTCAGVFISVTLVLGVGYLADDTCS